MNVVEFFAGSRSIGKEAEKLGMNVFSVDIENFQNIDCVFDIEFFTIDMLPFIPDIVWGSPPCTTYSIAAISHHRDNGKPKTDFAKKSDRVMINFLSIIQQLLQINPKLKWFIENPRGYMRKMDFMLGLPRCTVWYCQYGDTRAKPTDIWSNNIHSLFNQNGWKPRKECKNGNKNCHHQKAPRGSKTGTQGLKGNYQRSKIPAELCNEILSSCF